MNALASKLYKRITNFILAFVVATGTLSIVGPYVESASAATVVNSSVANLAADVAAAAPYDVIDIQASGTISSQVIITKPLTLTSTTNAVITVAEGINAIGIQSDDVTIQDLSFVGPYDIGEGAVTRALEVSSYNNITIQGNSFSHLRQPAYINDNVTGSIVNNYTEHTKGWVLVSNSDMAFSDNTWGINVLDIAIIEGVGNNYTDAEIVAISDNNNDAVVETQYGPTNRLSDAYVQTTSSGNTGDDGSKWNPYVTNIQSGLARIVEGGTVNVANGSYSQSIYVVAHGTKLVGESKAGVQITSSGVTPSGHAVAVEHVNDVTLQDLSFFIGLTGNPGYALKAYDTANLVVNNVDFTGRGNTYLPRTGGVDLNSVNGATISNVTAQNFSKNGFAVTAQYAISDPYSRNITFNNVTSANNAWAGVAFYTMNSSGTVGHDIPGVAFTGTTTVSNNPKGLEIVGDTDPNVVLQATPVYEVTDVNGDAVNLGNAVFSGNTVNIINYQTADLVATETSFDGKKGSEMTDAERATLATTIFDTNDLASLGEVIFYIAPTVIPEVEEDDSTTDGDTTPNVVTIITPIITSPASVLGDTNNSADNEGSSDVEGTTDDKTATVDTGNNGLILGLAWYWWILILAGATGLTWWLVAAYRRRNNEE